MIGGGFVFVLLLRVSIVGLIVFKVFFKVDFVFLKVINIKDLLLGLDFLGLEIVVFF